MVSSIAGGGVTSGELNMVSTSFGFEEKVESGDIDVVTNWSETTGGTASRTISNGKITFITGVNLGSESRIDLNRPLNVDLDNLGGASSPYSKFVLEFVMAIDTIINVDEGIFFIGLGATTGATRVSDYATGLILDGGDLKILHDTAGSETLATAITGYTGTSKLIRLEYSQDALSVYVDGAYISSVTPPASGQTEVLNIVLQNGNAADTRLYLYFLRGWFE